MSETIMQEIVDFGKEIWNVWKMIFADFVVPLAKQLATDEMALLVNAVETEIANMQAGFTMAKLNAIIPDLVATFAKGGVTIIETDVLKAAAAVMAKIESLNNTTSAL